MRSSPQPSTPTRPCIWKTACAFILVLQAAAAFALPRNNHRQHRRHFPTALKRAPRGGYVRTKKSRRNWFGISASSSSSAAAPTKPLPRIAGFSRSTGNSASPAPIPWKRLKNNNDTLDMLFPPRKEQLQNNHYPRRQPQQQHDQELLSYVAELKQQVASVSEEAAPVHVAEDNSRDHSKKKGRFSLSRLDVTLFGSYFCHCVAMTLPIVLLPLVAAEHVATNSHLNLSVAAVVATIASVSTFGTGIGKCLNGFVCQSLGGRRSSSLYLVGWAGASFLLSKSSAGHAGLIMFLMEFLASIQWTACSLVMANHYADRSPNKFSKGITILSLASTTGMIAAKTGGTALLKYFDNSWRAVAQVGSLAALTGAAIMRLAAEHPDDEPSSSEQSIQKKAGPGPKEALKAVLGSPLFWTVGIAHSTAMLARTCDRVLGAFFHQTTALPRSVCGGLTAFVTLGFVHGLTKGRQFNALKDVQAKTSMLSKCYSAAALSAFAMALCSNESVQNVFFPSQKVLAATVAALTGVLASNISFQFYQIPAITAATFFSKNKALCLSLFDAMGFLFAAPVWALTGKIVEGAGPHGWTLAWFMLAGMFAAGGKTMLTALPSVLHRQQQQLRTASG